MKVHVYTPLGGASVDDYCIKLSVATDLDEHCENFVSYADSPQDLIELVTSHFSASRYWGYN